MHVLSGSGEIRIVNTCGILHRNGDSVVTVASLAKVVVLEVECCHGDQCQHQANQFERLTGLGETIFVRDIVNSVDDVESIGSSCI